MQEREKTRCKSDMAYHCATHDTQWLDDESDRCEYKRMVDAEAAIARVRAVADAWEYYASENGNVRTAWAASSVREALDGDA